MKTYCRRSCDQIFVVILLPFFISSLTSMRIQQFDGHISVLDEETKSEQPLQLPNQLLSDLRISSGEMQDLFAGSSRISVVDAGTVTDIGLTGSETEELGLQKDMVVLIHQALRSSDWRRIEIVVRNAGGISNSKVAPLLDTGEQQQLGIRVSNAGAVFPRTLSPMVQD